MKTKTQLYRVKSTPDAKPGMFIYERKFAGMIIGFVSAVDKEVNEMEICTFNAIDPPDSMIENISEFLERDEVNDTFIEIMFSDPKIEAAWDKAFEQGRVTLREIPESAKWW